MEQDWRQLIVLDACRYDVFEKVFRKYVSGKLEKVITPAVNVGRDAFATREWCEAVFKETYKDTIYISGNPGIPHFPAWDFSIKDRFFKITDAWKRGWNEETRTVSPKVVSQIAQKTKKKYPAKRLIVHYMQPHAPYISLKG